MTYSLSDQSWWRLLVSRKVPVDTTIVVGFVLIADPIVLLVNYPPIRAVFGLPLLLFLPGYAILTVSFPASPLRSNQSTPRSEPVYRSVTRGERTALSVGVSLALLPLIALVFWAMDAQGFNTTVLLGVLTAITVVGMMYGTHRRLQLPKRQRYRVPVGHWLDELTANGFSSGLFGIVINLALVASIILAAGTLGYVIVVPNQSASYTRVSLLTRDASGDLSVANYSTEIEAGTGIDPVLAIENHEDNSVSYTVIVEVQRVNSDGQRVSSEELARLRTTVPPGETGYVNHTVVPTMIGENLKLQYLIYKGDPPSHPTATNAYRTLFLWVDISNGQTTGNVSEMTRNNGSEQTAIVMRQVIN